MNFPANSRLIGSCMNTDQLLGVPVYAHSLATVAFVAASIEGRTIARMLPRLFPCSIGKGFNRKHLSDTANSYFSSLFPGFLSGVDLTQGFFLGGIFKEKNGSIEKCAISLHLGEALLMSLLCNVPR